MHLSMILLIVFEVEENMFLEEIVCRDMLLRLGWSASAMSWCRKGRNSRPSLCRHPCSCHNQNSYCGEPLNEFSPKRADGCASGFALSPSLSAFTMVFRGKCSAWAESRHLFASYSAPFITLRNSWLFQAVRLHCIIGKTNYVFRDWHQDVSALSLLNILWNFPLWPQKNKT